MLDEHHAVLLLGPIGETSKQLPKECRHESADVHLITCDAFTIDDARTLKRRAEGRPVESSKRRFVIKTQEILREAQHALLKLFEDPPATAQFFVLLEHDRGLLPTLRSRFHVIVPASSENEDASSIATSFLAVSSRERLEEIKQRLDKKDHEWVRTLMRGLEYIYAHNNKKKKEDTEALKELVRVGGYVHDRGASKKMLLEHLALSLPQQGVSKK